jgi:F0F1-type ATP synthase membrane subunit b/b'
LFVPVNRLSDQASDRIAGELKDAETIKAEAQKMKSDYERR